MGLLGTYSNPEIQGRLRQLAEKLDQLAASKAAPRPSGRADHKLRNGLVPRAIRQVLVEAEGPMRVCDIHASVEDRLGRRVPVSSVNCWLSKGAAGHEPGLVRLGHGRYRITPG